MRPNKIRTGASSRLMRYERVFTTLIKYGFEDILSHPPFNKIFPQDKFLVPTRRGKKVSKFTRYERIRMVCEELGTTFIKFAQIASNRPDLLPEELIAELAKLQDSAPAVPVEHIKAILTNAFPRPLDELLDEFDETPLASASIAQVHRAKLKGGKEVVLKIQRPNIKTEIDIDISILHNLVSIIDSYFPKYQVYNPGELVKMFEQSILEELSFRIEANNLKQFKRMFVDNSDVYVPDIYEELCTDEVLCLEYIDGYKITDLESLRKFRITGRDLALRGISLYFEQVFEHGFFHADPHPGNIFVMEDGKIAFIDYGMMGTVIESDKIQFANILLSMYEKDVEGLKKAILKFSKGLDRSKRRELEYDIVYFLRNYTNLAIENIDGNEVMKGLNALFFDYKIQIPAKLLLLLKALMIIEGVGLKLDPEYDIIANIGPFAKKLMSKKYNAQSLRTGMIKSIEESTLLMQELPEDLREILHKIRDGKLRIEFQHRGLSPLYQNLDIIVNRLAFTLIIVAVVIASSLIVIADLSPKMYNVPVLGLVGFAIAAILTIRLLYSIATHGRI